MQDARHPLPSLLLLSALALAPAAHAQIVVGDGDDLVAAVASAPDGSVIEIQSDQTFLGTLSWGAKGLTIRAGAGFEPRIKGDPSSSAVLLTGGSPEGSGTFEDLTFVAGDVTPPATRSGIWVRGDTPAPDLARLTLTDCLVDGRIDLNADDRFRIEATITGSDVLDDLYLQSTQNASIEATVLDCQLRDSVSVIASDTAVVDVEVRRCRILDGFQVIEQDATDVDIVAESCLVIPTAASATTGIQHLLVGVGSARYVNCTVTGFTWGLMTNEPSAQFENMLVYGNFDDVSPGTSVSQVKTSMIGDGTFAGFNGNVQGTPNLDAAYTPLPGSPGIDLGNPTPPSGLGLADLYGNPRTVDGDLDGTPRTDVGAVESPVCQLSAVQALAVSRVGTPPNPDVFLPGTYGPIAGTYWDPVVDHTSFQPGAVFDFVGVTALPANQPLPPFVGTLLCDLFSAPPYVFTALAGSPFAIPIPADCSLPGVSLCAQGVSWDLSSFAFTNALDLTLGAL